MSRLIEAFAQFFDGAGDPLEDGWLLFLESGTVSTLKNTYYDSGENTANSNPVQLDAEGRCPNIFGTGTYKVISYTNDELLNQANEQIQVFDPVGGNTGYAQWSDWDSTTTYDQNDLVRGTDGNYYRSLFTDNINNNPVTTPSAWDLIGFYAPGAVIPVGGIIMWSGAISAIPSGWLICDGTLGTPNLTDRFVIHADSDSGGTNDVGDTGGSNTISEAQLPTHTPGNGTLAVSSHTHSDGTLAAGNDSHSHGIPKANGTVNPTYDPAAPTSGYNNVGYSYPVHTESDTHNHSITGSTGGSTAAISGTLDSVGSDEDFKPRYYALAYIMKG